MSFAKDIDRLLRQFLSEGLPGCSLLVSQRGQILYEGYFGHADVEKQLPVTKDTIFRLASMSKLPLYTTLLMLYERGKFLLTDPITNFLPEWKESRRFQRSPNGQIEIVPCKPITFSDVLSMKCGLPYCNSAAPTRDKTMQSMQACMKPLWEKGTYTVQEHVAAMSKAILAFEPGTQWLYGFSSEIAAALIEQITDLPVNEAFRKMLFEPLGMGSVSSRYSNKQAEQVVKLYMRDAEGNISPASGFAAQLGDVTSARETGWARLCSNTRDYTKLMQMLANGGVYDGARVMGRKTIDMMRANGLTAQQLPPFQRDPENAGYGYGYGVRTLIDQQMGNHNGSLGAFGWAGGFGTWCEADPSEGVSIVYFHNCMSATDHQEHLRIRAAAYGLIK